MHMQVYLHTRTHVHVHVPARLHACDVHMQVRVRKLAHMHVPMHVQAQECAKQKVAKAVVADARVLKSLRHEADYFSPCTAVVASTSGCTHTGICAVH